MSRELNVDLQVSFTLSLQQFYVLSIIIWKIFQWAPWKPNTILDGSAESNPKLRHTLSKYQFAIILKIKIAINNNIQNFVSLRPWIKYSGCLHWIMFNPYKISDGFCLDTFYTILMYRDIGCKFLQKMMGFL